MKMRVRVLSIIICLALLMSAAPAGLRLSDGFATEAELAEALIEEPAAEAPEAEAPDAAPEAVEVPPEEPAEPEAPVSEEAEAPDVAVEQPDEASESEDAPVEDAEPEAAEDADIETEAEIEAEQAPEADAVDYGAAASASPAFSIGCAEVIRDEVAVYADTSEGAKIKAMLNRGVVYAVARSAKGADRLEILFNAGPDRGMDRGWVDAAALRPMEPEAEVPAFVAFCADLEDVLYPEELAGLPLARISCAYPQEERAEAPGVEAEEDDEAEEGEAHPVIALPEDEISTMPLPLEDPILQLEDVAPEAGDGEGEAAEDEIDDIGLSVGAVAFAAQPVVSLKSDTLNLGVGESCDLVGTGFVSCAADEGARVRLGFAVTEGDCVSVSEAGTVFAARAGTATVAITEMNSGAHADLTVVVQANAKSVSMRDSMTLGLGMTAGLDVTFPDGGYSAFTLSCEPEGVVELDQTGKVTAIAAGETTVTLRTGNGLIDTCFVRVVRDPVSIEIEESEITIALDEDDGKVVARAYAGDVEIPCDLHYEVTEGSEIVRVDEKTGALTPLNIGTATIVVRADGAAPAECTVSVATAPAYVNLRFGTLRMGVGETYQISDGVNGIIVPAPGSHVSKYTYISSNASVVSVSETGLLTAKAKGTENITIRPSGQSDPLFLEVTVEKAASSIKLSKSEITLKPGESEDISVSFPSGGYSNYELYFPAYASGDEEEDEDAEQPVEIIRDGENSWTLQAAGSFAAGDVLALVAKAASGATASCIVKLVGGPNDGEIEVELTKTLLGIGETGGKATARIVDGVVAETEFTYRSSNPNVISVDSEGNLTANTVSGEDGVVITATATTPGADGYASADSEPITVVSYPTKLEFAEGMNPLHLGVNDVYPLCIGEEGGDPDGIVRVSPSDARTKYTYALVSGDSYASVSSDGVITAKKPGTMKLRILPGSGNNLSPLTLDVVVSKAADSISLSRGSVRIGAGMEAEPLKVSFPAGTYARYSATSSNEDVVRLHQSGDTIALEAVAAGQATIKVTTAGTGCVDSCLVTVVDAQSSISLDAPLRIGVGEVGRKVSAAFIGEEMNARISFQSNNPGVLSVDASTGALTAKGVGVATIGAYLNYKGDGTDVEAASQRIQVVTGPNSISLEPRFLTLRVDEVYTIREDAGDGGMIMLDAGTSASYTFASGDPKIASVSAAGEVKGLKAGDTTITITAQNGTEAKLPVTVVKDFDLTISAKELGVGMSARLSVPASVGGASMSFICDPEGAVEFSADGSFVAKRAGICALYARAASGDVVKYSNAVMLNVLPAPEADEIVFSSESVNRVTTYQAGARVSAACAPGTMAELQYRMGAGAPAGVSVNAVTGELTIGGSGSGTSFTVEAYDKNAPDVFAAHSVVIVGSGSLAGLRRTTLNLVEGEIYQLSDGPDGIIQLDRDNATGSYKFKTSKKAVATVSEYGLITAKKAGTAKIRITDKSDSKNYKDLTVKVAKKADSVSLSPAALVLGLGMTGELTPSSGTLALSSSNEEVATVDALGSVRALSIGETTITATDPATGNSDTTHVRVVERPLCVEAALDTIVMGKGEKNMKVSAEIVPAGGSEPAGTIEYRLVDEDDKRFVTVNQTTGALTAKRVTGENGPIRVRAYVKEYETLYADVDVEVVKKTSVSLTTKTIKLSVGNTYQLRDYIPEEEDEEESYALDDEDEETPGIIKLSPEEARDNTTFSYKSSKSSVASVSAEGLITAKATGTAKITISTQSNRKATLTVQVLDRPTSISLNNTNLELSEGMESTLKVVFPGKTFDSYSFSSEDEEVASVDAASGKVTAAGAGETIITARTANGLVAYCRVAVLPVTSEIQLFLQRGGETIDLSDAGDLTLGVGEKNLKLIAEPEEGTSGKFLFKISEDSPKGKLSVNKTTGALSVKKTTDDEPVEVIAYEANHEDEIEAAVSVEILKKPAKKANLTLSPSAIKLGVGESFQITEDGEDGEGVIHMADGYAASYSFKSSDTKVASVSSTGLITAKGTGSAKVRVSTQNSSVYRDLTVTVAKKAGSVQIPPTLTLGSGMETTITPSFTAASGDGSAFGFMEVEVAGGSGRLDASVNAANGKITLSAGTVTEKTSATLIVRLPSTGLSDTCSVTLLPAPKSGEVEFDYENMPAAVRENGRWIIRVGQGEKGVTLAAKCTVDAMSGFTYSAASLGGSGLTVNATTGALSVSKSAKGSYSVTATSVSNPGATATGTVEIVSGPTAVYFHTAENPMASSYTLLMGVGEKYQISEYRKNLVTGEESGILVLSPEASSASFTFAASAKSNQTAATKVLSVDKNSGLITANQEGTAYIKVTTQNSKTCLLTVNVVTKPDSVELVPDEREVGENSSGRVSVKFTPANSSSQVLSYVSSDPSLLRMGEGGFFETGTLHQNGVAESVTITATTSSGHVAYATIRVLPHPAEVRFAQESYEVSEGMTIATAPGPFPAGQKAQRFSYRSENPETATIDSVTGEVTGVREGEATITITANPGTDYSVQGTATVRVLPAPARLSYEGMGLPDVLRIAKDDLVRIPQPVAYSASGSVVTANYKYALVSNSDKSYLSIEGDSMKGIKALPEKNSDIGVRVSVYNNDRVYIDLKVRVYDETPGDVEIYFEGRKVNGATIPMYVNAAHATDSIALTAQVSGTNVNYGGLTFSSSKPELARVDANGLVTVACGADGKAPSGTAKIYAEAGSMLAECTIQVGELCENPELRAQSLQMQEGDKEKIDIGYTPSNSGMRLLYASGDSKVVTVDSEGNITAVSGGETKITVTGQYGWSGELSVSVLYDPDDIRLPVRKLYMNSGDTLEITPELSRKGIELAKVNTYTRANSSYPGVVRVEESAAADQQSGRPASYTLTAVTKGSASVTFATHDGKLQAVCEIEVDKANAKSGFGWDSSLDLYMIVGDTASLEYGLTTEAYNLNDFRVEVAPQSAALAQMQPDGRSVTALEKGTATLQLTAGGEVMDSVQIQIIDPVAPKLWYGPELKDPVRSKQQLEVGIEGVDPGNHTIRIERLPAPKYDEYCVLLGTFSVTIDDPSILDFDATTDRIHTKEICGTTTVTVESFGSAPVVVEVTVTEATVYRALLISEYDQRNGNLPFTGMNVQNMEKALKRSDINGKTYDTKVLRDPYESDIKSAIKTFFADTKENDISVLYIVAHGHMGSGSHAGEYCFSLGEYTTSKASTYVTDTELMNWIQTYIQGRVILVLDSCNSGAFISHQRGVGLYDTGNIAVITAQVADKPASFYVGSYKDVETYEFFTRAFHIGLGYQTNRGSGDDWNNAGNADANGDGMISIQEIYDHTRQMTINMVSKYCWGTYFNADSKYGFKAPHLTSAALAYEWLTETKKAGGKGQDPQSYIPSAMKDLAFFGLPS